MTIEEIDKNINRIEAKLYRMRMKYSKARVNGRIEDAYKLEREGKSLHVDLGILKRRKKALEYAKDPKPPVNQDSGANHTTSDDLPRINYLPYKDD